jgi:hypothetical protein
MNDDTYTLLIFSFSLFIYKNLFNKDDLEYSIKLSSIWLQTVKILYYHCFWKNLTNKMMYDLSNQKEQSLV